MVKFPLVSDAAKKRWQDPEYRRKQSEDRATRDYSHLHTVEVISRVAKTNTGKHPSRETRDKISASHKGLAAGEKNPMFGKPPVQKGEPFTIAHWINLHGNTIWYGAVIYPDERTIEQKRLDRHEKTVGGFWYGNIRYEFKGVFALPHSGSHNPHWKGGVSTLNHLIRDCQKGLDWRQAVFERDHYTCQVTGIVGGRLHAHHIIQIKDLIEKFGIKTLEEAYVCEAFWDVSNGVTMTEQSHKNWHQENGK